MLRTVENIYWISFYLPTRRKRVYIKSKWNTHTGTSQFGGDTQNFIGCKEGGWFNTRVARVKLYIFDSDQNFADYNKKIDANGFKHKFQTLNSVSRKYKS